MSTDRARMPTPYAVERSRLSLPRRSEMSPPHDAAETPAKGPNVDVSGVVDNVKQEVQAFIKWFID